MYNQTNQPRKNQGTETEQAETDRKEQPWTPSEGETNHSPVSRAPLQSPRPPAVFPDLGSVGDLCILLLNLLFPGTKLSSVFIFGITSVLRQGTFPSAEKKEESSFISRGVFLLSSVFVMTDASHFVARESRTGQPGGLTNSP